MNSDISMISTNPVLSTVPKCKYVTELIKFKLQFQIGIIFQKYIQFFKKLYTYLLE